ncbi:hypothetical protein RCJ22_22505, partial [Vibrio sp. FNV 38]|nr:hypothetical protein [Vibrio sp. FNV 38]
MAHVVCKRLGIDTEDYSCPYIVGWSKDREMSELKDNLKSIQETSIRIIDQVEKYIIEHTEEKTEDVESHKEDREENDDRQAVRADSGKQKTIIPQGTFTIERLGDAEEAGRIAD